MDTIFQSSEGVNNIFSHLVSICGSTNVIVDRNIMKDYGADQASTRQFEFEFLVTPNCTEEISCLLKLANEYKIPVTPRGGGSGVTGGAIPITGGIVLSLEKMNKILVIDTNEKLVITEPGVITQDLCDKVEAEGLYFPVSPSSRAYSQVGGNVAENAGSMNSAKYGNTAQFVINLEVVLPTGEIIWTGSNVKKSATGLNITGLFVGSEGILGVITKVVYRLIKKPIHNVVLLASFESLDAACMAIREVSTSGITPCALELIGKNAIELTCEFLGLNLDSRIEAQLFVELDEYDDSNLEKNRNAIAEIFHRYTMLDVQVGESESAKEKLRELRMRIGDAMTHGNRKYRDIDTCIPVSMLLTFLRKVEEICYQNYVSLVYFGHALDGNIHTMLLYTSDDCISSFARKKTVAEIFAYSISIGGVLSGEHGIGMLQKEYLSFQYTTEHISLLKNIKKALDPNTILNPGKIVDIP